MTGSLPSNFGRSALPAPNPGVVSPADRDRVVDLLQVRFANDGLSLQEFESRVSAAYQAKSSSELHALVADLGVAGLESIPERARIVTILSNNERTGAMPVPRCLEIVNVMGNVELDLSGSAFAPGLTEINISALLANVELTVPLGIRVESSGSAIFGNFNSRVPNVVERVRGDERVIRITGRAIFSSVEITAAPARTAALAAPLDDAPRRLS